jgi:hypothetical protein
MEYIQGDFIVSLVDMKSSELTKQLKQTIDDAIKYFLQLYIDSYDKVEENTKLYTSNGYMYQNKINMYIDLLTIKEENETKRLMFAECFKYTVDLKSFSNIEQTIKLSYDNKKTDIKDMASLEYNLSQSNKKTEILEDFSNMTCKLNDINKSIAINMFNDRVNWFISLLVKLKTRLVKGLTDKAIY